MYIDLKILGIESTCDETSAAVVEDGRKVLSCEIVSQADEHSIYGGVVPEIASRMHTESIVGITNKCLASAELCFGDIDAVAVSAAPGLIGAVLVGLSFAKGLSVALDKPLVPVHHIRGHIASCYITYPELEPPFLIGAVLVGLSFAKGLSVALDKPLVPVHHIRGHIASCYITYPELEPPFLCLVASGGHSLIVDVANYTAPRVLGQGIDDAAGEVLDKVARVMGLGYPGGAVLDRLSEGRLAENITLPYPNTPNPLDFSFSGLKTSVINLIHNAGQKGVEVDKKYIASALCTQISTILLDKTIMALDRLDYDKVAIVGGVSANSQLRTLAKSRLDDRGIQLYTPELKYCGDNAAMIAAAGYYEYMSGNIGGIDIAGAASMSVEASF